jgi:hypothetical protein
MNIANRHESSGCSSRRGGRFDGWGLYLLKGKPVFTYNMLDVERFRWEGAQVITPGRHTVVFDFKYDGPGLAKGGTGVLTVDGREVARRTIPHTVAAVETLDEWCDIGYDTRTGVDDRDYRPPFRFTGKINKLTLKIDRPKLTPEDEKRLRQATRNNRAAE